MNNEDDPYGGLKCLGCEYSSELFHDSYCAYVFCRRLNHCVPKGDECEEWRPKINEKE